MWRVFLCQNVPKKYSFVFTGMNPIKEIEELLSKVKLKFYTEPEQPATVPVQLSEYQLADGTTVTIDKLEVGGVVMVADAPVMDGEYQLADGTKLMVVGGAISEIQAPAPAEPAQEDMSSKFAAIETRLQGFEQALNAAKSENENLKATFAKQEELNQHFIKMFETLVKEPNTAPTEPVKNGFRKHSETKENRLDKITQLFNKQKN